jgi:hypothetical protein
MTPPARFFALDGDGASDRPMCRRPRAAFRPMLACAVVRCAARLLPYLFFSSAAVFVFSLLSFLRPPPFLFFAPKRRMSGGAFYLHEITMEKGHCQPKYILFSKNYENRKILKWESRI